MKGTKEIALPEKHLIESAWRALKGEYPKCDEFSAEDDLLNFAKFYKALKTVCAIPPSRRKEDELREILQSLKISSQCSSEILKLMSSSDASTVDAFLCQSTARLPHITNVEWRVNVVISSSFVARAMVPYVEVSFSLSDGRNVGFEMNLKKFHSLRFSVAKLLKEIQHLELRPALQ